MKKLWTVIGIAAAVLVCLLAALFLFSRGDRIDSGDASSLYPYYYEQRSGKLSVHITGEFPKNCKWTAETESVAAAVKPGRQNAKHAVFTLTAQQQGSENVSFILSGSGDLPDRRYEINCRFFVTDELTFVTEECSHEELAGLAGEDGERFSYRVASLSDSELYVRVTHAPAQTWRFERVNGTVLLNGLAAGSGKLLRAEDGKYSDLRVAGSRAGVSTVYLSNEAGDCVELSFSTGSTGVTSLLSYRILGENDVRITADTAFADNFGDVSLKIDSVLGKNTGKVERWLSRDDNVTTFTVGVSELEMADAAWMLCISPIADEADFAGHTEPTKQVTAGDASANLYAGDFGVRCVWRIGGNTYLLESADGTPELAEHLTAGLLEALAD